MITFILAFFGFTGLLLPTAEANFNGDIFAVDSHRQNPLYHLQGVTTEKDGLTQTIVTFTDPKGDLVLEEKATTKGPDLLQFDVNQKQTETLGSVKVVGDEVIFEKTKDGKTKTEKEKLKTPLVISGNFSAFIKSRWSDLTEGKTVSFRYAAWERMETVGFDIKKIAQESLGGKPAMVLKMSASNFVIAAVVDPLIFKYIDDGNFLAEMKGRVAPKKKDGSSWKDLDAEVVYQVVP